MSTIHELVIWYAAYNKGSREAPFKIIRGGSYGIIHNVFRKHRAGVVYKIILHSRLEDPEELLHDLKINGVFVLRLTFDGKTIFENKKLNEQLAVRLTTEE